MSKISKVSELKKFRQKFDLTQEEVGEILDVKKQTVYYFEKKDKLPEKYKKILEEKFNFTFSLLEQTEVIKDDCLSLPVRGDVNASMGYGVTVYEEKETGVYHISRKLAADLNINKNSSEIIFASGDSMHPTIQGGDSLLIDRSKTEVHDGRIYCVRIDGQVYAKRLQKIPPATIVVISDNPKYKSFEINLSAELDYDFEIIGEIKWWGRIAR